MVYFYKRGLSQVYVIQTMTFGIHSKGRNNSNVRHVTNCGSRSYRTNARKLWRFACDVLRVYVRKQRFFIIGIRFFLILNVL